jgi:hypothetical protein
VDLNKELEKDGLVFCNDPGMAACLGGEEGFNLGMVGTNCSGTLAYRYSQDQFGRGDDSYPHNYNNNRILQPLNNTLKVPVSLQNQYYLRDILILNH